MTHLARGAPQVSPNPTRWKLDPDKTKLLYVLIVMLLYVTLVFWGCRIKLDARGSLRAPLKLI